MQHHTTKALVLGGGPAGGATALGLAQAGYDVVLLERSVAPVWKIGETLPPEARVHLQRLKHLAVFLEAGHLPCHGIVSCWGSSEPVETDFVMNPYGHGWQLDRIKFESDLLQAARGAGCRIFFEAEAHEVRPQSGGWSVETSTGVFQTEWLLDCTGRNGILAQNGLGGSFEQLQDYVSLFCVLNSAARKDHDARTYVEAHSKGWSYSALMPNGSRVIAFLTDRDLIPPQTSPEEWLQQVIGEGEQIKRLLEEYAYSAIDKVRMINAESGRYQKFAGSNWALVGDAGMTFDPLSGWGSAKAMVSAAAAVQMVLKGSNYQSACEELWKNYVVQWRDYYLAERRWPDAPFWLRRAKVLK